MNQPQRKTVRILSTATVIAGLMLLGTSVSWAQQKPLKGQLVGAWTVVSQDVTPKGGTKGPGYGGPNPTGILILDASGRYAWVFGRPDRPKLKSAAAFRTTATTAELAEAMRGIGANFGTWSVNEADKTLIRKVEFAANPNNANTETKASVSLDKDELRLVGVNAETGARTETVYRRAK